MIRQAKQNILLILCGLMVMISASVLVAVMNPAYAENTDEIPNGIVADVTWYDKHHGKQYKEYAYSIQQAFEICASHEEASTMILFPKNDENRTIKISKSISVYRDITVDMNGAVIDCQGKCGAFDVASQGKLTLKNSAKGWEAKIINGKRNAGGAINVRGVLEADNIIFENCKATESLHGGGAIFLHTIKAIIKISDPHVELNNCQIINCSANGSGGAIGIEANKIAGADADGGSLGEDYYYEEDPKTMGNDSVLQIRNSTIKGCKSSSNGGAICIESNAKVLVEDSTIEGCSSNAGGGGIAALENGSIYMRNSNIKNCVADDGGAIRLHYYVHYFDGKTKDVNPGYGYIYGGEISGNKSKSCDGGGINIMHGSYIEIGGDLKCYDNHNKNGTENNLDIISKDDNLKFFPEGLTGDANVGVGCSPAKLDFKLGTLRTREIAEATATRMFGNFVNRKYSDVGVYNHVDRNDKGVYLGLDQRMNLISFKMVRPYFRNAKVEIDRDKREITVQFPFEQGMTMEAYEVEWDCGSTGTCGPKLGEGLKNHPYKSAVLTQGSYTSAEDEIVLEHNGAFHVWQVHFINGPCPMPPTIYQCTVINGTANNKPVLDFCDGDSITFSTSPVAHKGHKFLGWVVLSGDIKLTEAQKSGKETYFTIDKVPAGNITLLAKYEGEDYKVDVTRGKVNKVSSGYFAANSRLSLKADTATPGQIFAYWTHTGKIYSWYSFQDYFPSVGFTMPYDNVTFTANYIDDPFAINLNVYGGTIKSINDVAAGDITETKCSKGDKVVVAWDEGASENRSETVFDEWEYKGDIKFNKDELKKKQATIWIEDSTVLVAKTHKVNIPSKVTVFNGTVNSKTEGMFVEGETLKFEAYTSGGMIFDHWSASGITLTEEQKNSKSFSIDMPDGEVVMQAVYQQTSIKPHDLTVKYCLAGGTGGTKTSDRYSGSFFEGSNIPITADFITDANFDHWDASGITLTDEQKTSEDLNIDMPDNDVTLTAIYNYDPVTTRNLTVIKGTIKEEEQTTKSVDKKDSEETAQTETESESNTEEPAIDTQSIDNEQDETIDSTEESEEATEEETTKPETTETQAPTENKTAADNKSLELFADENAGTSTKNIWPGTKVTIVADTAPEGQHFVKWQVNKGDLELTADEAKQETLEFYMCDSDVEIEAIYADIPILPYSVKVTKGTVNGYEETTLFAGTKMEVVAYSAGDLLFDHWEVTGIELTDEQKTSSRITDIQMPEADVTFEAIYSDTTFDYQLGVIGGTISDTGKTSGVYREGTTVAIIADEADADSEANSEVKIFKKWKVVSGEYTLDKSQETNPTLLINMPASDIVVEAEYDIAEAPNYIYLINGSVNGSKSGAFFEGDTVAAYADTAGGITFDHWETYGTVELTAEQKKTPIISFAMPDNMVVLRAMYTEAPDLTHALSVVNGTAHDVYEDTDVTELVFYPCSSASVKADDIDGKTFDHWEAKGLELTDEQKVAKAIEVTLPDNDVKLTAVFKDNPGPDPGPDPGPSPDPKPNPDPSPDTGDSMNVWLLVALMVLSGSVFTATIVRRKKRRTE